MGVRGYPSAAAEDPDGQGIRNALPSDGGAFPVPGEDHSFGMKTPCPRMALKMSERTTNTQNKKTTLLLLKKNGESVR